MIAALFMGFGFVSCEKDSILTEDEDETPSEWELVVDEGEIGSTTVYVKDLEVGADEVDVTVKFTSTDGKMRRLYMTQNIAGAGAEKFELEIPGLSKKKDGSLDLSKNEKKEFNFKIPFPVLTELEVGTVVYELWATSGTGDYRNTDKRLVVGPGTITVDYGGTNPANAKVKEYTAKLLAAPLADGSSKTFISVMDGQLYTLSEGEEYAAFWDFGYYYKTNPSLASTSAYPAMFDHDKNKETPLVAIAELTNTPQEELNNFYFTKSTLTTTEFDGIINSSDLKDLAVSTSSAEEVNNLKVDDIVEFIDNYGKKGLIKVIEIELGTKDLGYGAGAYIKLDIKVQP